MLELEKQKANEIKGAMFITGKIMFSPISEKGNELLEKSKNQHFLERVFQDFDNTNFRLNLKILIIDINKYFI
jgi:hypothetical protein